MQLYAALSAREQALLNELGQLHKTKAFTLTEQRDRLRIFQACLESSVQRAMSTVQSGNTELLVARTDIKATFEALEKQPLLLKPQMDCVLDFHINLEQLLDLLSKAGMVSDKSTCAANTTAEGAGLKVAMPGREVSFTITARDAQGRLRDRGGDFFTVEPTESDGKKVKWNVKDKDDGTYMATYTCPADSKGANLRLSVLLCDTHIKDSPFVVHVIDVPVGEVICYCCSKRTHTMIYYKNNSEPSRNDAYRVNGCSAFCSPHCESYFQNIGLMSSLWIKCYGPC